jgi:hypothetical protein
MYIQIELKTPADFSRLDLRGLQIDLHRHHRVAQGQRWSTLKPLLDEAHSQLKPLAPHVRKPVKT